MHYLRFSTVKSLVKPFGFFLGICLLAALSLSSPEAEAKQRAKVQGVRKRTPPPTPRPKSEPLVIVPDDSDTNEPEPVSKWNNPKEVTKTAESQEEKDLRRWNVRYQVPGILFNSHSLEVDFAITQRLSAGLIGNYTRRVENGDVSLEYTRRSVGGSVHFYVLSGNFSTSSLYLKSALAYSSAKGRVQDGNRGTLTKLDGGLALTASVVYQFMAPNGVNLHLGVGMESRNYPDRAEFRRSESGEQVMMLSSNAFPLVAEMTIGYAF